jgi:hypothetical protein
MTACGVASKDDVSKIMLSQPLRGTKSENKIVEMDQIQKIEIELKNIYIFWFNFVYWIWSIYNFIFGFGSSKWMTEHHLCHIILACHITHCHVNLHFPHMCFFNRLWRQGPKPKWFSHSEIIHILFSIHS